MPTFVYYLAALAITVMFLIGYITGFRDGNSSPSPRAVVGPNIANTAIADAARNYRTNIGA